MQHREGNFTGLEGLELYYQAWLPEGDPVAVLLLVHGLAEHSSRYGNVVNYLVPRGYAVYAPDHRGHGRSGGQRAHVERFDDYLVDLKTFFDMVRGWHPDARIFVVGHSMGGAISLTYALRHQAELDGLLLSAASLKVGESVSPLVITLGKLIARLFPRMGMVMLDASAISRDPAVVAAYENDPLVYRGKMSARLGAELIGTMQALPDQVSQLRLPVLIMHGTDDRLADPQGSQWLFESVGSSDKTLKLYQSYYHEIFNEPEHARVLADVETWLAAHC
jgi:alpha-beta hydrolase superfamily lysophospholipase